MRLIDADAPIKELGKWIEANYTDTFTGADAGSEFAYMIGCAKTIDIGDGNHDYTAWAFWSGIL